MPTSIPASLRRLTSSILSAATSPWLQKIPCGSAGGPARVMLLAVLAASRLAAQDSATPAPAGAGIETAQLDKFVVTASRTPLAPEQVASAISVIQPGDLAEQQITNLGDALRFIPGVSVAQTGGRGGVTSLLIRGSKAAQTLLLVDGVRFSDTNTAYTGWLGGFSPGAFDRVEILRGPQSTLYGGTAMGGVIAIGLDHGRGAPSTAATVEAGSFGTRRGVLASQGASGALAYALTASSEQTDNNRPFNKARLQNYALRVDYQVSKTLAVGGTFRYLDSHYQDPNDIRTYNTTPLSNNDLTSRLVTLFAELAPTERWTSRLTAGRQDQDYANDGSFDGSPSPYSTQTTRHMVDWQNTLRCSETATVVAGANYERSAFTDGGVYPDDKLWSYYVQGEWQPAADSRVGVGLRSDDYTSFGHVVTGRLTANQVVAGTGSRWHATVGTSFVPPSLSQRYGSAFTAASPGIKAEKSTGWDLGVEQTLVARRLTADVTYFRNTYKDLIAYQGAFFPALGNFHNIGRARAEGIETSLNATLSPQLTATATWTWLEAKDEVSGARLDDRPRHSFSGTVSWQATAAWQIGAAVQGAADRLTTDFNSYPSREVNPHSYTVVRVYSSYRMNERCLLRARIENLLDKQYEETYGFPSAGLAAYAGVEWKF